jgi:protein-L-isoaspartate(D-aspartate) O-methyltransferase
MTDFKTARRMMVDGQVRPNDVTDPRLIGAFLEVPREHFVPAAQAAIAYLDLDVPVLQGAEPRYLIKPMLLAKLLSAAGIKEGEHVLDVGSAIGYSSAILSKIAGSVVALEPDAELSKLAQDNLRATGSSGIAAVVGPLSKGWPGQSPYDVIVLNGATEIAPLELCKQLKDGGRLVGVLGRGPASKAMLYTKSGDDISGRIIFDAAAPLLPGFAKVPAFAF